MIFGKKIIQYLKRFNVFYRSGGTGDQRPPNISSHYQQPFHLVTNLKAYELLWIFIFTVTWTMKFRLAALFLLAAKIAQKKNCIKVQRKIILKIFTEEHCQYTTTLNIKH